MKGEKWENLKEQKLDEEMQWIFVSCGTEWVDTYYKLAKLSL